MEHLKLSLLISSFIIPLILSITLFVSSKNNLPKHVIAWGLLNTFFVFLFNYFYFRKIYETYALFHSFHIATVLWIFPSIYLYVKSLVSDETQFRKELFHLLPGLLFGLTSAVLFYGFLNQQERIFYLSNYRTDTTFSDLNLKIVAIFRVLDVLFIVTQVIYYSITMIRIPGNYEKQLKNEFSNIENFSIRWVWWFVISFVLVGLFCIAFYMFNPFHESNELFLVFFLFIISAFTWVIGLWSFKQEKPNIPLKEDINAFNPPKELVKGKEDELAQRLIAYFENEKPYLQADLTLTFVCKKIGTNRTYLSSVINSCFGMNFNSFVNRYRIRFANEFKMDHPDATKEELAQTAGFGSVSSLKRALNKTTDKIN